MTLNHEHLEKIQSSAISADDAAKLAATGWPTIHLTGGAGLTLAGRRRASNHA